MPRTKRITLAVLVFGLVWSDISAARTMRFKPRPIGCAQAVELSVKVDGAALWQANRATAELLEHRLLAAAIRRLGANRIAIDPDGPDLRLEILENVDGEVLVAISSPGIETDDDSPDAERLQSERNALKEILPVEILATPTDLELVALDLLDQTIAANWGSDCDPSRTLSANGRFAFELPPSHPEARERYLSSLAEDGWLDASDLRPIGSLVSLSADGEEERLSTFRLDEETSPQSFLLSLGLTDPPDEP